jgi:hypothetical protein
MSTLSVSNITDGTDTVETGYVVNGSAKAWVNFNGTGTPAIQSSLNTSSIEDKGTGHYGVNFTSAMSSNSGYAASSLANHNGGVTTETFMATTDWLAGSLDILAERVNVSGRYDPTETTMTINGDLA